MGVPGCPEFACCTASMLRVLIVLIESKSLVGILTFWQITWVPGIPNGRTIASTAEGPLIEGRRNLISQLAKSVPRRVKLPTIRPLRASDMFFHDGYRSRQRVRSIVWGSRSAYRIGFYWYPAGAKKSHKHLFISKTFLGKTFELLEIKSFRPSGEGPSNRSFYSSKRRNWQRAKVSVAHP